MKKIDFIYDLMAKAREYDIKIEAIYLNPKDFNEISSYISEPALKVFSDAVHCEIKINTPNGNITILSFLGDEIQEGEKL